ncbi:DUF3047 domain-containing protein [bacterium]|nr:DUF3047 domain-containing protein [bacterium]
MIRIILMMAIFVMNVISDKSITLENFENDTVGNLPENWFNRDGKNKPKYYSQDAKKNYQYAIEKEEGNQFLRYDGWDGKHLSLPLGNRTDIDLMQTPVLSWRWRAWQLPSGAYEYDDDKNDVALSVYVVYKFSGIFKSPVSIRYTWSTSLPKGKIVNKNNQKIMVLESGMERSGQWLTIERNIAEDYENLFGENPPKCPVAILILSDADNTKTWARGDYDDFILKSL